MNESLVGGKAASLAKMKTLLKKGSIEGLKDVTIPDGIALTAKAMQVRFRC